MGFLVELLGHVITLRGQLLVSKTDDDVLSPLVYVQIVPVLALTTETLSKRLFTNTPITLQLHFSFSNMPNNKYMKTTVTVFIFARMVMNPVDAFLRRSTV